MICVNLLYPRLAFFVLQDSDDLADWLPSELRPGNFSGVGLSASFVPASSTLSVPRVLSPLRRIIARFPRFLDLYGDGTAKLAFSVHTLECGHQQHIFHLVDDGQVCHRCPECAQTKADSLPPKKPSASVTADRKKAA